MVKVLKGARIYPFTIGLNREAEQILKHRSVTPNDRRRRLRAGLSRSQVVQRMITRYHEMTERCTPALARNEWEMLRTLLGRGPFPDVVIVNLDTMIADGLRRRPFLANARKIDIQSFNEAVRRWTWSERCSVIDGLERPIDGWGGTPILYADEDTEVIE